MDAARWGRGALQIDRSIDRESGSLSRDDWMRVYSMQSTRKKTIFIHLAIIIQQSVLSPNTITTITTTTTVQWSSNSSSHAPATTVPRPPQPPRPESAPPPPSLSLHEPPQPRLLRRGRRLQFPVLFVLLLHRRRPDLHLIHHQHQYQYQLARPLPSAAAAAATAPLPLPRSHRHHQP